ncbi:hypothetical protein [Coraliomargarita sinensis]|nr:hypothetical protein [Coraliomargarita sinensis]
MIDRTAKAVRLRWTILSSCHPLLPLFVHPEVPLVGASKKAASIEAAFV